MIVENTSELEGMLPRSSSQIERPDRRQHAEHEQHAVEPCDPQRQRSAVLIGAPQRARDDGGGEEELQCLARAEQRNDPAAIDTAEEGERAREDVRGPDGTARDGEECQRHQREHDQAECREEDDGSEDRDRDRADRRDTQDGKPDPEIVAVAADAPERGVDSLEGAVDRGHGATSVGVRLDEPRRTRSGISGAPSSPWIAR